MKFPTKFFFILMGFVWFTSLALADEPKQLNHAPERLLVQFKDEVWLMPINQGTSSIQKLQNIQSDIAEIFEEFGVYKVRLQFDVDNVLNKARSKYSEKEWEKLSISLPSLRYRYLLYLENPSYLESLKSALDQSNLVMKTAYDDYLSVAIAPNDSGYGDQYWLDSIDMESAWDISTDSSSIPVAIIDGGFQHDHEDLQGNIVSATDSLDADGDPLTDDMLSSWSECSEHGTHVAGIVGAVGNNNRKVPGSVTGVNWTAALQLYRTGDGVDLNGLCKLSESAVEFALQDVIGNGAKIVNYSATYGSWIKDEVSAIKSSILFISAAGNTGADDDNNKAIAGVVSLPNVLQVAGSKLNGEIRSTSDYGANSVDLAAPGTEIYSTIPTDTYGELSGTSMAAPMVSGVSALAWSVCPELSVQQIRQVILDSVEVDITNWGGKTVTEGMLNGYFALLRSKTVCSNLNAADLVVSEVSVEPTSASPGDTIKIDYIVSNVGPVDAGLFKQAIYFSIDRDVTTEDTLACTKINRTGVSSERSVSQSISNCSVPEISEGIWYIGVLADSSESVSETNEDNNIEYDKTGFSILTGDIEDPDLTVSNADLDTYVGEAGDSFTPTVDIQNIGDGDASGFSIAVVFSEDSDFNIADDSTACLEEISSGLTAGSNLSSYSISTCTVPDLATTDWSIGIIVDSKNEIAESEENNNTTYAGVFALSSPGTPDLSVYSIYAESYIGSPSDTINIDLGLQNLGDADSSSFDLTIVFSDDEIISIDDVSACSYEIASGVPAGSAGDISVVSLPCIVPNAETEGFQYVGVVLDTSDEIVELDETNNTGYDSTPFTLGCSDGTDNDSDDWTDNEDPGCATIYGYKTATELSCTIDQDTYVDESTDHTSYGTYSYMRIGESGSGGQYESLLECTTFENDISTYQSDDCEIVGVQFDVYISGLNGNDPGIRIKTLDESWSETSTWDDLYPISTGSDPADFNPTSLGWNFLQSSYLTNILDYRFTNKGFTGWHFTPRSSSTGDYLTVSSSELSGYEPQIKYVMMCR